MTELPPRIGLARLWERFFAIDLRSLAAFRIGLAGILLLNLALRARDLEAHFTDFGVLPRSSLLWFRIGGVDPWSLHALSGGLPLQILLFLISAAAAIALALGFRTRWANVACWLLLISLEHRNPLVLTGGDIALRLMLFWSIFLPLGQVYSLDARSRPSAASRADSILSIGGAMLLVQIALIYPVAALFKWREPVWRELEAFRAATSVDGVATPFGQLLAGLPAVPEILSALSLGLETGGVLLAFSPWRTAQLRILAVGLFAGFHLLGTGTTFRIGLFPVVMAIAWIPYLPAEYWQRIQGRRVPRDATPHEDFSRPVPMRSRPWVDFLAGAFGISVLLHNAATLGWIPGDETGPKGFLRPANALIGLDQRWSLWTGPPSNRYFVIAAQRRDGTLVDLRRGGLPLDWRTPARRSRNSNWWKMELSLSKTAFEPLRAGYGCHWMRAWNRSRAPSEHANRLEGWMLVGTREEVASDRARRLRLWTVESEASTLQTGVLDSDAFVCPLD